MIVMAASIAALAVLGISFSLFLSRLFALPIKKLHEGVDALAGGNLDYRLNIPPTEDEFGQLTRGFNVMAERLKGSYAALEKRIDELERFRKATTQREFRMKEMKDRVKELENYKKQGDES